MWKKVLFCVMSIASIALTACNTMQGAGRDVERREELPVAERPVGAREAGARDAHDPAPERGGQRGKEREIDEALVAR